MMSSPVMATAVSGSIPNSVCCLFTSRTGQAEKRTLHPFGNSELKGRPLPPPGTVTHDRDLRKETHHIDEIVRSAVGMPVGQDNDRAQPTSTVRRGKIDRIGLGKIVMPVSFLILRVTRQNPFLKETRGDAVGIEHGTTPLSRTSNINPLHSLKCANI